MSHADSNHREELETWLKTTVIMKEIHKERTESDPHNKMKKTKKTKVTRSTRSH